MHIILIKFESLCVCMFVCVLGNSSYSVEIRITNDSPKDFLELEECS